MLAASVVAVAMLPVAVAKPTGVDIAGVNLESQSPVVCFVAWHGSRT